VGLVPKTSLLEAGRFYLERMGRSRGVPESDIVHTAVRSLGLSEVSDFEPREKIIEEILAPDRPLASMTLQEFADETSRDSAAPGGGSVAALAGALGASLAAMVANLPHPKSEFEGVRAELEEVAVRAQVLKQHLLNAIDADTWAFQKVMEANRSTGADRDERVREATLGAAQVPLEVAEMCPEVVELCSRAREIGLAASASDAGVGAGMARAAALGAAMNVRINLQDMVDDAEASAMLERANAALRKTRDLAAAVEETVWGGLGGEVSDL
jgi:glutamate formiminotransferase/formiminotetrahydrofolate cyclodeaminase